MKAADSLEAAVLRARELEAQAEGALRQIAAYPEVAAWEAIRIPAGEPNGTGSLSSRLLAVGADLPAMATGAVARRPVRSQDVSVPQTTDGLHTG